MDIDKEDDPDEKPEPRRRHFPWQDEDNEAPLPPLERSEYAKLLQDLQDMQDRGRPMVEEYHRLVSTDPTMDVSCHSNCGCGFVDVIVLPWQQWGWFS